MKIVPDFIQRNWSLKLLALTIALVVFYAFRERDDAGRPALVLPTPKVVVRDEPPAPPPRAPTNAPPAQAGADTKGPPHAVPESR